MNPRLYCDPVQCNQLLPWLGGIVPLHSADCRGLKSSPHLSNISSQHRQLATCRHWEMFHAVADNFSIRQSSCPTGVAESPRQPCQRFQHPYTMTTRFTITNSIYAIVRRANTLICQCTATAPQCAVLCEPHYASRSCVAPHLGKPTLHPGHQGRHKVQNNCIQSASSRP
jgi:hypothetical protein